MNITGIIMAGGKSSRMGTDKGLLLFKNSPLIIYPINKLSKFCSEIVISTNNEEYDQFGYRLINDEHMGIGPIGGIYSALKKSKNNINLIVACDMPFVSDSTIISLINQYEDGVEAIIPKINLRHYETLFAIYTKSCIKKIENQIYKGNYSLQELIPVLNFISIDLDNDPNCFININSADDLKKYE